MSSEKPLSLGETLKASPRKIIHWAWSPIGDILMLYLFKRQPKLVIHKEARAIEKEKDKVDCLVFHS
jgi:hypothetical protein